MKACEIVGIKIGAKHSTIILYWKYVVIAL